MKHREQDYQQPLGQGENTDAGTARKPEEAESHRPENNQIPNPFEPALPAEEKPKARWERGFGYSYEAVERELEKQQRSKKNSLNNLIILAITIFAFYKLNIFGDGIANIGGFLALSALSNMILPQKQNATSKYDYAMLLAKQ